MRSRKNAKSKHSISNYTRESIKNFNLYKACFQHDMAYEIFKDLSRRTGSKKALSDKA